MGKKAKLKAIRRLANELPKINIPVKHGELVLGKVLIAEGIKQVEDKPVIPDKYYRKFTEEKVPYNHNRKLKDAYNKYGEAGVTKYLQELKAWEEKQKPPEVMTIS